MQPKHETGRPPREEEIDDGPRDRSDNVDPPIGVIDPDGFRTADDDKREWRGEHSDEHKRTRPIGIQRASSGKIVPALARK
jgi:hypothetical protein